MNNKTLGLSVGYLVLGLVMVIVAFLILSAIFMVVFNSAAPVLASPWSSNAMNFTRMGYLQAIASIILLIIFGSALFGSFTGNSVMKMSSNWLMFNNNIKPMDDTTPIEKTTVDFGDVEYY